MAASYVELNKQGKLEQIIAELKPRLKSCDLCPRNCKAYRTSGSVGFCRTKDKAVVNSSFLHFGEEPELVGSRGSGTIFFSSCNMACIYCQNYHISHLNEGKVTSTEALADFMLELKKSGAHNINLVSPTHVIVQILEALKIAADNGLDLPLVYNSGGYDSAETLKAIEGVFDIYMPDIKYSSNSLAFKYSGSKDYWDVAKAAVLEMQAQVGDLKLDGAVATQGLLVRHLVLPENLAGSEKVLDFIKKEISSKAYINIMEQYFPSYWASQYPELTRRITIQEYQSVCDYARQIGLHRGF